MVIFDISVVITMTCPLFAFGAKNITPLKIENFVEVILIVV